MTTHEMTGLRRALTRNVSTMPRKNLLALGIMGIVWTDAAAARLALDGIQIVAQDVEGQSLTGSLLEMDFEKITMRLADGVEKRIPLRDLVRLEVANGSSSPAAGWRLQLVNGDVLVGWPAEAIESSVNLSTRDLGPVTVPLDAVRLMEMRSLRDLRWARRIEALATPRAGDDMVCLSNGDTLTGFVLRVDHEALVIDVDGKPTRVGRDVVVAVRFANPSPQGAPKGVSLLAELRDGSRITLTSPILRGRTLHGETLLGKTTAIEIERLFRADVVGGRWERLCDLTPIEAVHIPMISASWPTNADRNVLGEPIRVAGRTFEHGIGVHSRSEITFDIGGRYREFVTSFGMDDSSGPGADVSVRIVVDGQICYALDNVRRGKLHGPIRVDLSVGRQAASSQAATSSGASAAAQRLGLIVDFGENGDVLDRFNWVESGLVRR